MDAGRNDNSFHDQEQFEGPEELCFDQSALRHILDEPIRKEQLQPTACSLANNPELNEKLKRELLSKMDSSAKYMKMLVSKCLVLF